MVVPPENEIGSVVVVSVWRLTIMGAEEKGQTRQRVDSGEPPPGCRRACSGVC